MPGRAQGQPERWCGGRTLALPAADLGFDPGTPEGPQSTAGFVAPKPNQIRSPFGGYRKAEALAWHTTAPKFHLQHHIRAPAPLKG